MLAELLPGACQEGLRKYCLGFSHVHPIPGIFCSNLLQPASAVYFWKSCCVLEWGGTRGRGHGSVRAPLCPACFCEMGAALLLCSKAEARFPTLNSRMKHLSCLCYQSASRKYQKRIVLVLQESRGCVDITGRLSSSSGQCSGSSSASSPNCPSGELSLRH